jgi:hypothetical protein
MPKAKRSASWSDKQDSGATLRTPDRDVTVYVKLKSTGDLVIEVFQSGGKRFYRKLTPQVNYDD